MKRNVRILLLIFAALLFSIGAQAQVARVETVQFKSKLMNATLPYNVVLPPSYVPQTSKAPKNRLPVLYLLHGLSGHYTDWASKTKLAEYVARHNNLIVVTPEGNNGWYTDSPVVPADKYESYIMQELIPDVESRYRTITAREGRAIAGLSMGGYGALKFGVKYPDRFIFAASLSGAFGVPLLTEQELSGFAAARDSVMQAFGPVDSRTRTDNDIFKLFRAVSQDRIAQLPYIYLDCGTEDYLFKDNRTLADILVERKIPHEFRELPGKHEWPYWDQQVRAVLMIAEQRLAKPAMETSAQAQ